MCSFITQTPIDGQASGGFPRILEIEISVRGSETTCQGTESLRKSRVVLRAGRIPREIQGEIRQARIAVSAIAIKQLAHEISGGLKISAELHRVSSTRPTVVVDKLKALFARQRSRIGLGCSDRRAVDREVERSGFSGPKVRRRR